MWPFSKYASKEKLSDLENKLDGLSQDLDNILKRLHELEDGQEDLQDETKRLDKVIQEVKEESLESESIDLQAMEQEIFKVLMRADSSLTYREIGKRMDEKRTPAQVRPKLISLKDKVTILEDKDGRAKVFKIPKKTKKDYIEKGEITEVEDF